MTRGSWRLELPANFRIHPVFHTLQLKLARSGVEVQKPPLLVGGEEEFEVEAITQEPMNRGRKEYLV